MTYLFITRKYPPAVGGMEALNFGLTQAIRQHIQLELIAWGGSQRWLPLFALYAFLRALWLLWTRRIECVHLGDVVLSPLGVSLQWLSQRPVFVTACGLDVTYASSLYQALIRFCLPRLAGVVSISAYTQAKVLQRGVRPERAAIIEPGVDLTALAVNGMGDRLWLERELGLTLGSRPLLVLAGRMVERKGFVWFARVVLPRLAKELPEVFCLFLGDGPQLPVLRDSLVGYEAHAAAPGRASPRVLWTAYACAHAFVMPNLSVPGQPEGFGIVSLEARAVGTPVIAPQLEGIPDSIVDGGDGILVTSGQPTEFVTAIARLVYGSAHLWSAERIRARVRANYAWSRVAKRYVEVFSEWMA